MKGPRAATLRGVSAALCLLVTIGATAVLAAPSSTVPPPTPVPVPGGGTSPSPFPTALATPSPSALPPDIRATSAVLVDLDTGQVLFDEEGERRRPIASLTKIMTALLVLRRTQPTDVVTVSPDAAEPPRVGIAQLDLQPGETITVEQLLYALLLQSANDAADALAEHVSGSVDAFVAAMNAKARRLGLRDTRYASPNGLDDSGYSSALDLARLTRAAYREPLFAQVVATKFHDIPSPRGGPRVVQNRNALLWLYPGAIGVKTGYTSAAGFCVVAAAEREGLRLVAVVLGEPGEPFSDAAALLNFGFSAFERRLLVEAGEPLDPVEIDGRSVQVSAGASLEGLVPTDAQVRRTERLRPGAAFPPPRGERIGALSVWADDLRLGSVPLVVADVPPPPPADPGPWWRRAGSALVRAVGRLFASLFG